MGVTTAALAAVLVSACTFDASGPPLPDDGADAGLLELPCRDDSSYMPRDGTLHTYRLSTDTETYDEAFAACARDGAHLIVIDDMAEDEFVFANITTDTWLGMDDLTAEGTFAWITGAPRSYDGFIPDEPNSQGNEDCIEFRPDQDPPGWNDTVCDEQQRYICECDPTYEVEPVPDCMTDSDYDALEFTGRRYFRAPGTDSWPRGRDECESKGAYLVVVGDGPEDQFVRGQTGNGNDVWIGYSDRATEGDYVWVNGAPAAYEGWGGAAPENDGQDCVRYTDGQSWDDRDCMEDNRVLCECDPSRL